MSEMILYYFPLSTTSQKVRLCQHHKGISLAERIVDLTKLEQLSLEYLLLNPSGQVPTLVVDGQPLFEASIINEFLNERFPDKPLLPDDAVLRARIRAFTKYIDTGPTVEIATPTYRAWVAPAFAALPKEPLLRQVERAPEPAHRTRWLRTINNEISDADVEAAYLAVERCLARMELLLESGPYLFGADYSLADVEATPIVVRLQHLSRNDLIARFPRVSAWFSRVGSLPNFAPVYAFLNQRS
jgi:glutathione S-transferase